MSSPSSIASSSGKKTPKRKKATPKSAKKKIPQQPTQASQSKHLDVRSSYKFKGKMKHYKAQQELSKDPPNTSQDEPSTEGNPAAPPSPSKMAKSEIVAQDTGGTASGPPRMRARPSLATFQASTNPPELSSSSKPHPLALKSDTSLPPITSDPPPDSYPGTPTTTAPSAPPETPERKKTSSSHITADVTLYDPYTNCTEQPPLTKSACLTDLSTVTTTIAISPLATPYDISVSVKDLDHAKNLVLDLLGWGVEPEFLVDEGISYQLIYRVFTDLNLRLPTNLRAPP